MWINVFNDNVGMETTVSVYPEDARKFAMELLKVADECERA